MVRSTPKPRFGNPPKEYSQRYHNDVARAFDQYVSSLEELENDYMFSSRAELENTNIPSDVLVIGALTPQGNYIWYKRDSTSTAVTDAGGQTWGPVLPAHPDHYAENTSPGTTVMRTAIMTALSEINTQGGGIVELFAEQYAIDIGMQFNAYENCTLRGQGVEASSIVKVDNTAAAGIRFYRGKHNYIRDLTLDCDGYDGRGVYLQDRYSKAINIRVLDCPDRPLAMNGGTNTVWGLDEEGRDADNGSFSGVDFEPYGCEILDCQVYNSGRTALSQKQMRQSRIVGNYVELVYSEAVTADGSCANSVIAQNHFNNVARTDGSTAFPDKVNGGYLTVGSGGVGGCGVDASDGVRITDNLWTGIQADVGTRNDRTKAAINFVNNITASFGAQVRGNVIRDAKCGVLIKSGSGGNNFKHTVVGNTFFLTGTGAGTGSAEFGDVWIDASCTGHVVKDNQHPSGTLLISDATGNNWIENHDETSFTPTLSFGGGSTGLTYTTQSGRYQRVGRRVTFEIEIEINAVGSSTGTALIEGLPYTADANAVSILLVRMTTPGVTPAAQPYCQVEAGTATIGFYNDRSLGAVPSVLDETKFSNGDIIVVQGHYEV